MSVGPSVSPLVRYIYFQSRILLFWGLQWAITAPAQLHATEIAVYKALFVKPTLPSPFESTYDTVQD